MQKITSLILCLVCLSSFSSVSANEHACEQNSVYDRDFCELLMAVNQFTKRTPAPTMNPREHRMLSSFLRSLRWGTYKNNTLCSIDVKKPVDLLLQFPDAQKAATAKAIINNHLNTPHEPSGSIAPDKRTNEAAWLLSSTVVVVPNQVYKLWKPDSLDPLLSNDLVRIVPDCPIVIDKASSPQSRRTALTTTSTFSHVDDAEDSSTDLTTSTPFDFKDRIGWEETATCSSTSIAVMEGWNWPEHSHVPNAAYVLNVDSNTIPKSTIEPDTHALRTAAILGGIERPLSELANEPATYLKSQIPGSSSFGRGLLANPVLVATEFGTTAECPDKKVITITGFFDTLNTLYSLYGVNLYNISYSFVLDPEDLPCLNDQKAIQAQLFEDFVTVNEDTAMVVSRTAHSDQSCAVANNCNVFPLCFKCDLPEKRFVVVAAAGKDGSPKSSDANLVDIWAPSSVICSHAISEDEFDCADGQSSEAAPMVTAALKIIWSSFRRLGLAANDAEEIVNVLFEKHTRESVNPTYADHKYLCIESLSLSSSGNPINRCKDSWPHLKDTSP